MLHAVLTGESRVPFHVFRRYPAGNTTSLAVFHAGVADGMGGHRPGLVNAAFAILVNPLLPSIVCLRVFKCSPIKNNNVAARFDTVLECIY